MIAPTMNIKNKILAIPAAASDMPPKPKIPATIAITIQTINTLSIIIIINQDYNLKFRTQIVTLDNNFLLMLGYEIPGYKKIKLK